MKMKKPIKINRMALERTKANRPVFSFKPPDLYPGVVPKDTTPAVAMDYAQSAYNFANNSSLAVDFNGFPGYPYLAALSTRAEFRQIASTLSNEMSREFITIESKQDDADTGENVRVKDLALALEEFGIKALIQQVASNEALFGRSQIYIDIKGHDDIKIPLVISSKTIKKGALIGFKSIEPMWTTPSFYNALDPAAPDFYVPREWFMLGKPVHSTRLLTVVTRPLPDMLKPAYNFGGMSMTQLAESYVDNWLRTRQSVSDMIDSFSKDVLKTDMSQVLQGGDGTDIDSRADMYNATKSNRGLMIIDKDREELLNIAVPLSGLHELQAQSQEHMCSVTRIPAIILTGISPSGLNASSDGEIRIFYDWIMSQLEAHYRKPLKIIIDILQLHLFGDIDDSIGFCFNPLWQMDAKELAQIRSADANTAAIYIDRGVLDASEVREKLAHDPESGYQGLDLTIEIVPPDNDFDDDQNDPFREKQNDDQNKEPSEKSKAQGVIYEGEKGGKYKYTEGGKKIYVPE